MANNQQLLLGEGAGSAPAVFVEDVFSTYLYTGTGATQTITNGIDLSTKGGLVWVKSRAGSIDDHILVDTARGTSSGIRSNSINAASGSGGFTSFNIDGFSFGSSFAIRNDPSTTYASWTFRKQKKFFDVVTYTGNGVAGRTIAHDLGSVPGCIIVKSTSDAGQWGTYHRSLGASSSLYLNSTIASFSTGFWDNTTPTATHFSVASTFPNNSGSTYVAYIFAHDAGGFGLAGTDNVISCGSFTDTATGGVVNLGYEPQFVLVKTADASGQWYMLDTMRGWVNDPGVGGAGIDSYLGANSSSAEFQYQLGEPTATGFRFKDNGSGIYIYIAIRRGPMKVPTVGTSVFATNSETEVRSNSSNWTSLSGFPVDLFVTKKVLLTDGTRFIDRLRTYSLTSSNTDAEVTAVFATFDTNNGVKMGPVGLSGSSTTYSDYLFQRAPGFFDVVCWTGTNADQTLTHNLTVVPELIIYKVRGTGGYNWEVSSNFAASNYVKTILNLTNASSTLTYVGGGSISAQPTATQFSVGQFYNPASTMVAYLFATCAGVSKVGSYTGNGSSQTIACGFTAGSRFVMIKRTNSTGDWYVWDSARGIIAGNDPHLSLNDTAAEVTTDDSVDTDNSGFIVNQLSATNVNVTSATYIFLAIA